MKTKPTTRTFHRAIAVIGAVALSLTSHAQAQATSIPTSDMTTVSPQAAPVPPPGEMAQPTQIIPQEAPQTRDVTPVNLNTGRPISLAPPPDTTPAQVDLSGSTGSGFFLKNSSLNALVQYFAKKANLSYLRNPNLDSIIVNGRLTNDNPLGAIRELAEENNLDCEIGDGRVELRTQDELSKMPTQPLYYELHYLVTENNAIATLIKPFLTSVGTATVNDKTNTVVVNDVAPRLPVILKMLQTLDRPKRQVSIDVRIIRVNNTNTLGSGTDWSQTLGAAGWQVAFGTPNPNGVFPTLSSLTSTLNFITGTIAAPEAAIISPAQVTVAVHALATANRIEEVSNPNTIVEDNHTAIIRIVDRVPIVTTTVSGTGSDQTIAAQVRYKIDESDPTPSDTQKGREIGVSFSVKPTILPDDTVRMEIEPSVSAITSEISVPVGDGSVTNQYPEVSEDSLITRARIPNNMSLILGGYYDLQSTKAGNKVPVLGDIPGVSFFFKSKNDQKVRNNLVFIVTPHLYDAASNAQTASQSERIREDGVAKKSDMYADPDYQGQSADVNTPDVYIPFAGRKEMDTNPLSDQNPANKNVAKTPVEKYGIFDDAPLPTQTPAPAPKKTVKKTTTTTTTTEVTPTP